MTEFRPSRFQMLPPVIKNLLIINIIVFLAQNTFPHTPTFDMDDLFALHTLQSPLFKPWQIITHLFMHGSFMHIFGNMLALWMFGSVLENVWGSKRFFTFYFICGIGAAIAHLTILYFQMQHLIHAYHLADPITQYEMRDVYYLKLNEGTIGASGAVFGCLAAFGYLFPNTYIYLYFFVPIKAKWIVLGYTAFELYMAFSNSAGDNIAHVAHLGGAAVGVIMVMIWNRKDKSHFY